ncbi:MAG: cytochrome c-type biogenesis CcmF C-terminal domain-containing protein, partial [Gammaproteobacteria bacterium]
NVVLVTAAAAVLLGTLYPLFLDALGIGRISVGPPYFNAVFVPLMIIMVAFMGVGPLVRWKRHDGADIWRRIRWPLAGTVVIAATALVIGGGMRNLLAVLGVLLGFWAIIAALAEPWPRISRRAGIITNIRRLPRGTVGMMLAHVGIGLLVLGVTVTSCFSVQRDVPLNAGQSTNIGGYDFRFDGTSQVKGPNYTAVEGRFTVTRGGQPVTVMKPQKRTYEVQRSPMTEAAIDPGLGRDLYIALGDKLGDNHWSVRIQYKPMVRFIWLGGVIIALGGIIAASDRRYRLGRRAARAGAAIEAGEKA